MSFIDDFIYRRGILLNSFVDPKEEELDTDDLEVLYLKIIFFVWQGLVLSVLRKNFLNNGHFLTQHLLRLTFLLLN